MYGFENVERIGLRYINRIQFPERPLRWANWLAIRLPVPGDLGQAGGLLHFHFEQELSPGLQGIVNFVTVPSPPDGRTCVILDLDVIWRGNEPLEQLGALLERVHGPHHDLFESYLLDKTRRLFDIRP